MIMKHYVLMVLLLSFSLARPALADEPEEYGSLWVGPRVGAGLGFAGPRAGWMAGLQMSYRSPYYFYYNIEVGFTHLLPRSITVEESELAPEHDVDVTGLYSIPLTLDIGLRYSVGRARLRVGVGFGALISVQTLEALGVSESETIASFGFRPGIGLDLLSHSGGGMVMLDLYYLWQDASFDITGNDSDMDSLFFTVGYTWQVAGGE